MYVQEDGARLFIVSSSAGLLCISFLFAADGDALFRCFKWQQTRSKPSKSRLYVHSNACMQPCMHASLLLEAPHSGLLLPLLLLLLLLLLVLLLFLLLLMLLLFAAAAAADGWGLVCCSCGVFRVLRVLGFGVWCSAALGLFSSRHNAYSSLLLQ